MESGLTNKLISSGTVRMIDEVIMATPQDEPFYMVDVQDILLKNKNWNLKLPRVRPYYAVKCNNCPIVLEILVGLGLGFDCASKVSVNSFSKMG